MDRLHPDAPAETGLAKVHFPRRRGPDRRPYVTPDEADSSWNTAGADRLPFEATLGDGSVATPTVPLRRPALVLNADLTADEREAAPEAGGAAAQELDEGPPSCCSCRVGGTSHRYRYAPGRT